MPGEVRYFNQIRYKPLASQPEQKWHHICAGHDDMIAAIACHEGAKKLIAEGGHISPFVKVLSEFAKMPIPVIEGEMRIVKATTTIEVVEEPSAIESVGSGPR